MSELSERLREMSLHKRIRPGSEAAPWVCDEVEKLEARVKELEAINLGLVKALLEDESEKAKLVEALEAVVFFHVEVKPNDVNLMMHYSKMLSKVRGALADYRKED